ncbi:MAG: T9SS type A sorting domain-containing protein [Bacteroidia bacterium]
MKAIAGISIRVFAIAAVLFCRFDNAYSQKRNNIWCFGDSAGIDFGNLSNPSSFQSGMDARGSCSSIADKNGSLQFYSSTSYKPLWSTGVIKLGAVYNSYHQLMQNGDTLIGRGWYNEIVIIPNPADSNLYYVFTAGVTSIYGLYYSVVDLSLGGGLGAVVQKNVQLQSFPIVDCLAAIKHGNGRDWWLIFRKSNVPTGGANNDYYEYLITPSGIINFNSQSIGTPNSTNLANICFNKEGNMFVFTNYQGMIEKYDFDRCTGIISNAINILPERIIGGSYINYLGSAISPDGDVLYVSYNNDSSVILQYDLTAANIAATEDTIWKQTSPINAAGYMRLAPDNKIYLSCAYVPLTAPMYPYADSLYNVYNMNLSVINQPDSPGAACNFQPYSFYLGGKRTYWGLPNNPDYDMPRDSGSICDTIQWTGVENLQATHTGELFVSYVSAWQKLFVNGQQLKGSTYTLTVIDVTGRLIFKEKGRLRPPYFTKDLDCNGFSSGMYIINLTTDKEIQSKKFIKN